MTREPNDPTAAGASYAGADSAIVLSRNEIESLCAKAARGAGMSWGQAEEAGFAAGWLHTHGLDGSAALRAQLEAASGIAWQDLCPAVAPGDWRQPGAAALCPIAVGAALSDFRDLPEGALDGAGLRVGDVGHPILLLPFLARIADLRGQSVAVTFPGGEVLIDGAGAISGALDAFAALNAASVELGLRSGRVATPGRAPMGCAGATLAQLNTLAMRTTVPPSERSRADAGAGTSDND